MRWKLGLGLEMGLDWVGVWGGIEVRVGVCGGSWCEDSGRGGVVCNPKRTLLDPPPPHPTLPHLLSMYHRRVLVLTPQRCCVQGTIEGGKRAPTIAASRMHMVDSRGRRATPRPAAAPSSVSGDVLLPLTAVGSAC